ncbi:hypothetical protein HH_1339 [Helicobacter hepaticus ATCC 51449]|uniref:Uncharacterized protein n=1 Tax=Helicobacter hepaticus (strain ATCC 51449 / 3B1) TaxID=235279 RepID=Q7VGI2_HELHP|nr:hypothetical protein HH_1339 [Helicobacter hepaticus ATCC 51449]
MKALPLSSLNFSSSIHLLLYRFLSLKYPLNGA